MARRMVFLGSALKSRVDTRGPERPSWPDIDVSLALRDVSIEQLSDAFALALGSETDWDAVRVYFTGNSEPELLIPGRVLFVPQNQKVCRVEPITPAPATRLYAAGPLYSNDYAPSVPAGMRFDTDDPADSSAHNRSGGPITLYKWTGAGFDAGTVIANNGSLGFTLEPGGAGGADATARAADYSVDKKWNFADLFLVGAVKRQSGALETRPQYVSRYAIDMHGNAGDPTNPTVQLYKGPTSTTGGGRFADMSPQFFGRLAIDKFTAFPVAELGGHPYRPRLAPARWITFGQIAVAATVGAPASPTQALVTVPLFNAKSLEFLCRNSGGQDLYLLAVSPAVDDAITGVGGVPTVEPAPATQYAVIPAGAEGSLVIDNPRHPYCKILVGANAGGTTIAAGAVLTIKREVIE